MLIVPYMGGNWQMEWDYHLMAITAVYEFSQVQHSGAAGAW